MQALTGLEGMCTKRRGGENNSVERNSGARHASEERMGDNPGWNCALRPRRAECDEPMGRGIVLPVEHRAVVLAMTPAARRKAGVRILRELERRRNQRKREGRKQQDGEQTSHVPRYTSVRLGAEVRGVPFLTWAAINRSCRGLS